MTRSDDDTPSDAISQDVENVRSARGLLDDYEEIGTEMRDGSLKHAIEELKNARRKLDDY